MLQKTIGLFLFILCSPLLALLYLLIKSTSSGNFLFTQIRAGKNMSPFTIYKIRTMVKNAEKTKKKYLYLNEASEPVFKIKNDPRYTKIGAILSHSGLDELPQLINIIKGEMSFIGPRPLPINEAKRIPKKYYARFTVLPGITSPWVVKGSHQLSFTKWMELDIEYVKKRTVRYDILIAAQTILIIIRSLIQLP